MRKIRIVSIDGIIPISVFYAAFYRHIEATAFAAESKSEFSRYWHGEVHANGEFEVGYHSPKFQQKGGGRIGDYHLPHQIVGKITYENEKTLIQYENKKTPTKFIVIAIIAIYLLVMCMQNILAGDFAAMLPFLLIGVVFAYAARSTAMQINRFAKILNAIIEDCKKSSIK